MGYYVKALLLVRGTLNRNFIKLGENTQEKDHSWILPLLCFIQFTKYWSRCVTEYKVRCTFPLMHYSHSFPQCNCVEKYQILPGNRRGNPHIFMSGTDFSECFANSFEVWTITNACSLIKCTLLFPFCPCVDSDWNNLCTNFVQLRLFRTWKCKLLIQGRDYFKILVITLL